MFQRGESPGLLWASGGWLFMLSFSSVCSDCRSVSACLWTVKVFVAASEAKLTWKNILLSSQLQIRPLESEHLLCPDMGSTEKLSNLPKVTQLPCNESRHSGSRNRTCPRETGRKRVNCNYDIVGSSTAVSSTRTFYSDGNAQCLGCSL